MRLEIITFLTHMILLRGWEPPGVSSWILPKGAPPVCERGGAPAPAGGGSDSVYVCWFMCVSGKFPVRFQFYRTRCQSRKLRHVMFCNICIKNPNLRKILIFSRFIRLFGYEKPATASGEDAAGFDSICGMYVGLRGCDCLALCVVL